MPSAGVTITSLTLAKVQAQLPILFPASAPSTMSSSASSTKSALSPESSDMSSTTGRPLAITGELQYLAPARLYRSIPWILRPYTIMVAQLTRGENNTSPNGAGPRMGFRQPRLYQPTLHQERWPQRARRHPQKWQYAHQNALRTLHSH